MDQPPRPTAQPLEADELDLRDDERNHRRHLAHIPPGQRIELGCFPSDRSSSIDGLAPFSAPPQVPAASHHAAFQPLSTNFQVQRRSTIDSSNLTCSCYVPGGRKRVRTGRRQDAIDDQRTGLTPASSSWTIARAVSSIGRRSAISTSTKPRPSAQQPRPKLAQPLEPSGKRRS